MARARTLREEAKREAGVRVRRRHREEPDPSRREVLAAGSILAAEPVARGEGVVVYRGIYLPRQIATGTHAIALSCQHDHADPDLAIECAKVMAAVMPLRIEYVMGGPES